MTYNLSKLSLANGGSISQLKIPSEMTKGLGQTNPSIFINEKGEYRLVLRNVGYLFYHCEGRQKFQCKWGPLAYLHPEDDQTLRTTNFICDLDPNTLEITNVKKVNTDALDIPPAWEFIGLEDARLVEWDGKTILTGVRRDVKSNGEGRMEVSHINKAGIETFRSRIEPPSDPTSYCEKNWMPIEGMPYHYVKWTDPTEIVEVFPNTQSSVTRVQKDWSGINFPRDLRGSTHCIKYKDYYVALTHEVDLWFNEKENKDSQYYHRFIVWDKNWNIVYKSDELKLLTGGIEFTCGMAFDGENFLLPFGFQDSTSFMLKMPWQVFENVIGMPNAPEIKKEWEYKPSNKLLDRFVDSPYNENLSFELAEEYFAEGHFASALSFYLRTAEYGRNKDLIYDSAYMAAKCIATPGNRPECEESCWQNVISYDPSRPEGHLALSVYYEVRKRWQEAHTHASSAYQFSGNARPISKFIEYYGSCHTEFQKAVTSWWVGNFNESRELFFNLNRRENSLPPRINEIVKSNVSSLAFKEPIVEPYRKGLHSYLKVPFVGSHIIERNYSQAYQDMFILSALNGKRNGRYFEVGAGNPIENSNTYLLETMFGWKGTSIELDENKVVKFKEVRSNDIIHANAIEYNYWDSMEGHYDYLQLDIDPQSATFNVLKKIPFDKCTFSVITYEHDEYVKPENWPCYPDLDPISYKDKAREILESKGYVLIVSNIGTNNAYNFEDWYVHPDYVDMDKLNDLINIDDSIKYCADHMLK